MVEGGLCFNPGWHLALDLESMLAVSNCTTLSAIERRESRGGHTREDFPGFRPEYENVNMVTRFVDGKRSRPGSQASDARGTGEVVRGGGALMAIDTEPATAPQPHPAPEPAPTQLVMRLWRGDSSGGAFTEYRLPQQEGEVVLDVVHRIQATQAPDLAVRWNCKAGKCGSCSAEINGKPALMCMTRMSTLRTDEPITISPMRAFPTMRDLVTDVSYNFEVAKLIPAFQPRPRDPDGLYRMAQVDIDRGQEFHKCIECFLCQNVCHVIRDHEENKPRYAGPRFFVRLAELEMHPLDTLDRRDYIRQNMGIGYCNITKCCTEVCPEEIHITDNAIIPLKERLVDAHYDPIAWLGRKLRGHRTHCPQHKLSNSQELSTRRQLRPCSEEGLRTLQQLPSPALVPEFLTEEWFETLVVALCEPPG